MFCKAEDPSTLFPHCISLSILPFDFSSSLLLSLQSVREPGIQTQINWLFWGASLPPSPSAGSPVKVSSYLNQGFPGSSDGKASACNAGDLGLIPESGRFPGGGNDNPLQYSCLENPMNREAWQATFHVVAKSQTGLSTSQKHTIYGLPLKLCLRIFF